MLDLGDKYPSVKDLQKYVLIPALNEVNSQTDLTVSIEPRRAGRRITGFAFSIKRTDQLALSL
ncbi:Initiator Replication protein [compost metagenome]